MKIAHCIFSLMTGGAETMLIDIINEQVKCNKVYLIIINSLYNQDLLNKLDSRVSIIFINRKQNSCSPWPILVLYYQIIKIRPHILHFHSYKLLSLIRIPFIKKVYTAHDVGVVKQQFNNVQIFAISEAVKKDIFNNTGYNPVVIENGIKVESILKSDSYNNDKVFRIVQVARLDTKKKGQDILINALGILVNKYGLTNLHVDFIGAGDSCNELIDLVQKMGLEKNVNFLGLKDRDYIYSHLKDYHLMCHPSRYEGFGLVVAEAMAAKIPVLVSDNDGPYEVIQKGKYGYFFVSGNVDDCASKIRDIYMQANGNILIEKAYQHVLENYDVSITANRYIEEYKRIIEYPPV